MTRIVLNDLNRFMEDIKRQFGDDPDLLFRHAGSSLIVYISGLVNRQRLEHEIIEQLTVMDSSNNNVKKNIFYMETDDFQKLIKSLLAGMVVIASQGGSRVLLANVASLPHRNIEKPETEININGPREGFTELLETNVALIRRRLQSEKLRMKVWHIGTINQTEVRLLYLDGIAPQQVVEEMEQRLSVIRIEAVQGSNSIEEMIKDHRLSIFPTIQNTERPDVVTGALLNGKISILTNNTPFAMIAPFQFWTAFQAIEDYYINYSSATFLRLIRTIFIGLAMLLPSLYVAITTFHPEMLPTNLLLSFTAQRERSPFPAMIEALIMEITFEALREASIRLPSTISQTVSIVGALVIGQAIVQAGVISTPMVIVVSITGVASLTIPRYDMTFPFRILRLLLLVLAGSFGLFGIVFGLFLIAIYLTGIQSVGVPYLSPITPLNLPAFKDFLFRIPLGMLYHQRSESAEKNLLGMTSSILPGKKKLNLLSLVLFRSKKKTLSKRTKGDHES